jgi:hypothetical protein
VALWVDVFSAVGSTSAFIAAVGGGIAGLFYGDKANVTVGATAHVTAGGGVLLVVRPSARASGVLRMNIRSDIGSRVTVTEVAATAGGLADGRQWLQDAVFGPSWIEPGETIQTTSLFDLGALPDNVTGWRVTFDLATTRRVQRSSAWYWADRIFVPALHGQAIESGSQQGG